MADSNIINDMAAAMEQAKLLIGAAPLQKEIKLHPDDYKALLDQCKPHLLYPAPGAADSFSGLRVVVDEHAPRLPRIGAL
jgi:hypothetical protein